MDRNCILGIDLGGTNVRGGIVKEELLAGIISKKINADLSAEEVRDELFSFTDALIDDSVNGIGIGVPGLFDAESQMVLDVFNIPSWKKVPLKQWMEERYKVPVVIDNDANCFALGEFYFGKGRGYDSMVGLTVGTGMGSGIIINKKIYSGRNGGAGEFGMVDHKDQIFEYYSSGQFFKNIYNVDGETVFEKAQQGNADALKMYSEMGAHLGNAIKMILYALDVELIILGGSVRHAWPFFKDAMWEQIRTFYFTRALEHLKIEVSELENAGILGAAGLCYQ
ncbi:MAG: ROK family protein [Ginsengibacter sp.]